MKVITEKLLTPFGLKSLSPDDPEYIGYYEGDRYMRDSAYHRGTVWSWLMGPYIRGLLKFNNGNESVREFCLNLIKTFTTHLSDGCIGSVSEIFDGEFPNNPKGCFAQAWGVAELIRALRIIKTDKGARYDI